MSNPQKSIELIATQSGLPEVEVSSRLARGWTPVLTSTSVHWFNDTEERMPHRVIWFGTLRAGELWARDHGWSGREMRERLISYAYIERCKGARDRFEVHGNGEYLDGVIWRQAKEEVARLEWLGQIVVLGV